MANLKETDVLPEPHARPQRVTLWAKDNVDGTLRPVLVDADGNFVVQLEAGAVSIGTVVLGAGSAIAGKVGIDQTTPGTTDSVTTKRSVSTATATIANGASLSDAVALGNGKVAALQLPAAWTAAAITFQGSVDGGSTYQDIYDDGTERTIASASVVASRTLALDVDDWRGFTHIKVRSGTSGTPVNQGAQRLIVVALERGV